MMFAVAPSAELRQGDVCTIEAFPQWNIGTTSHLGVPGQPVTQLVMPVWDRALVWPETGKRLVAVCSYDCDIENPRTRTGLIVAPLTRVPAGTRESYYEDIMASHTPEGDEYTFLQLFPMRLPQPDGTVLDACVDFSSLTSMARAHDALPMLQEAKVLELVSSMRGQFRTKLAVFFGRPGASVGEAAESAPGQF